MTYCHKHRRHNCQTCIDELVSLGIQEDKERIAALNRRLLILSRTPSVTASYAKSR